MGKLKLVYLIWVFEALFLLLTIGLFFFPPLSKPMLTLYEWMPLILIGLLYPFYLVLMARKWQIGFKPLIPLYLILLVFAYVYGLGRAVMEPPYLRAGVMAIIAFIYLPLLQIRYNSLIGHEAGSMVSWLTPRLGLLLLLHILLSQEAFEADVMDAF